MPTDDEVREQVRTAVQSVPWNASNYPAKVQAHMLGQDVNPLTAKVTDAILPLIAEAVAAERERCARISGAETDFTDAIHTEARRRYPVDHTVDDPFGATGEARSDPYGYDEYAREAFLAGALVQHELERTRRLRDAAAIRADDAGREEGDDAVC